MLVGLIGRQRSGKDFAAQILGEERGVQRLAFADPIRDALYALNPLVDYCVSLRYIVDDIGWDQAKEKFVEVRSLLQRLGTEVGRKQFGDSFWVDQAMRKYENLTDNGKDVVFTDVRFGNEIETIRERGGFIWKIERLDQEPEDPNDPKITHASEVEWRQCSPDLVVTFPGSSSEGARQYRENVIDAWNHCRGFGIGLENKRGNLDSTRAFATNL